MCAHPQYSCLFAGIEIELPVVGVLVVFEGLHVVGSTAVVVQGIEGQGVMSVVLEVCDGDGDQLRKARHCFFCLLWLG